MERVVRPPTEAPLRFPSGACHGARPEAPVRCPPVPPASGASGSRGRRRGRTFEAAEPEGLQPCQSREGCPRAGGSGAPGTRAAAHPRRPIGQPPATLVQAACQIALPRHESVRSPARSAPRPGAPVADAKEPVRPSAGCGARPARVHLGQAAEPLALIECSCCIAQPVGCRGSVA